MQRPLGSDAEGDEASSRVNRIEFENTHGELRRGHRRQQENGGEVTRRWKSSEKIVMIATGDNSNLKSAK